MAIAYDEPTGACARDTQIEAALCDLRSAVSGAWDTKEVMLGRLARALSPEYPSVGNACKDPEEIRQVAPLADDITEMARQVRRISEAYGEMLNRLEL